MYKNDDIGMYKFHYISDTIYMKASKNKTETKKLFNTYYIGSIINVGATHIRVVANILFLQ